MTARINWQCKELHGKIRKRAVARRAVTCAGGANGGRGTRKSPQNQRLPGGYKGMRGCSRRGEQEATQAAGRQGRKEDLRFAVSVGARTGDGMRGAGWLDACMKYRAAAGSRAVMEQG